MKNRDEHAKFLEGSFIKLLTEIVGEIYGYFMDMER